MKRSQMALAMLLLTSCRTRAVWHEPEPSLERMLEQDRYDAYEEGAFFADGKVLQPPPRAALAYVQKPLDEAVATGQTSGQFVDAIPVPVTRALVVEGRRKFETFCSACHGVLGDGKSVVARYMPRRPRSLHEPSVRALRDGEIYSVISNGYGLMPPYAAELAPLERWSVVAYVRALERSQNAELDEMPVALSRRAEALLP